MSKILLKECAYYVADKISVSTLSSRNYISVNNMLPNKAGVTFSESVPTSGDVTAFKIGDILIGNIRPYFKKIWLATFNGGCSSDVLCIRCNSNMHPEYLFSVLSQDSFFDYDMAGSKGSKMPRGDKTHIMNYPIPIIDNMKKVGDFIIDINTKISINNHINSELESMIKTIYDYWFTQFDFPDENDKPYRSSGGAMIWNNQLKREIPAGWQVKSLLEVASWESNSQPPKSEFIYQPKEGYIRFIQNRDYDSNAHITYIPYKETLKIADRFDILMDKYGDAGVVRYGIEGAFNVALGKINVNKGIYQEYVRSFLGSDSIYNYLHSSCMASTRASLSESNLSMLSIVMPEDTIISKYQNMVHQLRMTILRNNDETAELTKLRDWLLPMLMSGQITFKGTNE